MAKQSQEIIAKKDNTLIQKVSFDYGLAEQKVFAFICYVVSNYDNPEKQQVFKLNLKQYCEIYELSVSGRSYERIWNAITNLTDTKVLDLSQNISQTFRMVDEARYIKDVGIIEFSLKPYVFNYISQLKENYTKINLKNWIGLKSKYSTRLHELLLSHYNKRSGAMDKRDSSQKKIDPIMIDINYSFLDLKQVLGIDEQDSYSSYKNFKQKILDVATKEINLYTNLNIAYESIKKGRKVETIIFHVKKKSLFELQETMC